MVLSVLQHLNNCKIFSKTENRNQGYEYHLLEQKIFKRVVQNPGSQMFCLGLYGALKISEPVFKAGRLLIKK